MHLSLSPTLSISFRCDVISHIPAGKTNTFQCNVMEGRYVVVVIPGRSEWLTLCEVEVFSTVKPPESSTEGTSFLVHLFVLSEKVCRIITLMNILIFVSNFGLVEMINVSYFECFFCDSVGYIFTMQISTNQCNLHIAQLTKL